MLTNCLAACAHLTITVSEIQRDIRFDVIHERDRQTDRQTLHDSKDSACIASRGKNGSKLHVRTSTMSTCARGVSRLHVEF